MPFLINDELVEDDAIAREAQSLRQSFQQIPAEERQRRGLDAEHFEKHLREWARENLIERVLLRQEARKDNEPVDAEAVENAVAELKKRSGEPNRFKAGLQGREELRAEVEDRIRLDRLMGRLTRSIKAPKNREVAEFYRRNRESFRIPEMVRAAHIVKNVDEHTDEETALSAIKQVEAELAAGGVFEELADKHSDCPGSGGALGIFPRGQMVQEFDDVVFALSPNQTSPVFRTPFGFHIAKVYEVTAAGSRSLADARQDVEQELSRRKQTKVIEDFVDRLKTQADIRDLVAGTENIVSR